MTTLAAVELFLESYVPEPDRPAARVALRLLLEMADTRARQDEIIRTIAGAEIGRRPA